MNMKQLWTMLDMFPGITAGEAGQLWHAWKDIESGEMEDINFKGHRNEQ